MTLRSTINFILTHPLSKGRRLRRMLRFVSWQVGSRLVPGPVVCPFVNGSRLLVRPGMSGATGNLYVGLHEFEDMAFLLHFLRSEDLFVDVGANVGSYTILASAAVGSRTLCFEPGSQAYAWLQSNIALNGVAGRVEARHQAVGGRSGHLILTIGRDTINHVVIDESSEYTQTVSVPQVALDDALEGRRPAMIKIDVEGFETEVINGAVNTLASADVHCLLLELNGSGVRYGFDESALKSRLEELGYLPYRYFPFERRLQRPATESIESPNTLFIRDSEFVALRLREAVKFGVDGWKI